MNPALALSFLTPSAPAPVANMFVDCLDPTCEVLVLDATSSLDADDYTWLVDGNVISSDEVTEFVVTSDFHTITLDVTGPGGSDSQYRAMVQGNAAGHPVEPGVIVPTVVAGVTSCSNGSLVISTIGGCFTDAKTVTQNIFHHSSNTWEPYEFDRMGGQLTAQGYPGTVVQRGAADGGVSKNGPQAPLEYDHKVDAITYGVGNTYPPSNYPNSQRLTSYTPVGTGGRFTIQANHVMAANNQTVIGKSLVVQCGKNGNPGYSVQ